MPIPRSPSPHPSLRSRSFAVSGKGCGTLRRACNDTVRHSHRADLKAEGSPIIYYVVDGAKQRVGCNSKLVACSCSHWANDRLGPSLVRSNQLQG